MTFARTKIKWSKKIDLGLCLNIKYIEIAWILTSELLSHWLKCCSYTKVLHCSALYHFLCAMKQEIKTSANLLDIQFHHILYKGLRIKKGNWKYSNAFFAIIVLRRELEVTTWELHMVVSFRQISQSLIFEEGKQFSFVLAYKNLLTYRNFFNVFL